MIRCFPEVCATLLTNNGTVSAKDVLRAIYVDEDETIVRGWRCSHPPFQVQMSPVRSWGNA